MSKITSFRLNPLDSQPQPPQQQLQQQLSRHSNRRLNPLDSETHLQLQQRCQPSNRRLNRRLKPLNGLLDLLDSQPQPQPVHLSPRSICPPELRQQKQDQETETEPQPPARQSSHLPVQAPLQQKDQQTETEPQLLKSMDKWTLMKTFTDFVNSGVLSVWSFQRVQYLFDMLCQLVKDNLLEGQLCDLDVVFLYRKLHHSLGNIIQSGGPLELDPRALSKGLHALYALNTRCLAEHRTCFAEHFLPLVLRLLGVLEQRVQVALASGTHDGRKAVFQSLNKILRLCPIIHHNATSSSSPYMSSASWEDKDRLKHYHNLAAATFTTLVARYPGLAKKGKVSETQSRVSSHLRKQQHACDVVIKVCEEVDIAEIIGGEPATTASGLVIPRHVHSVDLYIEGRTASGDVVRRVVVEVDGHVYHHTGSMTQTSKTRLRNALLQSTLGDVGVECCTFSTSPDEGMKEGEIRRNQDAEKVARAIMYNEPLPRETLMYNSLDALNVCDGRSSTFLQTNHQHQAGDQAETEYEDDFEAPETNDGPRDETITRPLVHAECVVERVLPKIIVKEGSQETRHRRSRPRNAVPHNTSPLG